MTQDLKCLLCNAKMVNSGIYHFHEGKRYGILGNLGELFVRKNYECPQCNKAELYSIHNN